MINWNRRKFKEIHIVKDKPYRIFNHIQPMEISMSIKKLLLKRERKPTKMSSSLHLQLL